MQISMQISRVLDCAILLRPCIMFASTGSVTGLHSAMSKMRFLTALRARKHDLAKHFSPRETVSVLLEKGVLSGGEAIDIVIPKTKRRMEQVACLLKVLEKKSEIELLTFAEALQDIPEMKMVGTAILRKLSSLSRTKVTAVLMIKSLLKAE